MNPSTSHSQTIFKQISMIAPESALAKGSVFRVASTKFQPSKRWVSLLAIVCFVALCASGYLAWVALTSSKVAGCGNGKLFNCGHVISSRWSLWMGIPVSLLAVGSYLTMGAGLLIGSSSRFSASIRKIGWTVVTLISLNAGLAAVWFISLQFLVIKHLCIYCLVAHVCGLVATMVVLRNKTVSDKAMKVVTGISLAGIAVLIGGQLIAEPPKTYEIEKFEAAPAAEAEVFDFDMSFDEEESTSEESTPDEPSGGSTSFVPTFETQNLIFALLQPRSLLVSQVPQTTSPQSEPQSGSAPQSGSEAAPAKPERRFVTINGGTVKLDVAQVPIVGSQKAKYIFVEMFDYACPHCRKTHLAIKGASEKLNGDMAVLALPVPLNSACNNAIQVTDPKFAESCELAKLAIAVWRVDPVKFTEFHNWLFTGESAPTYANAKAQAETMVPAEKLAKQLNSTLPSQYVAKNVELYKRAGSGNVPKLMFPGTSIVGEFSSIDGLVEVIQSQIK